MKRTPAGFTLLELLVVIGIIAVLAGVLMPVYWRVTANSKSTACASNLRQIGLGLTAYLTDNNNEMPILKTAREKKTDEVPVIDTTLDKYITHKEVFACPADHKIAAESGTSYVWNVAINGQVLSNLNFLGVVDQYSRIPLLGDKEGFHPYAEHKVNILYADGHATKELRFVADGK